VVHKDVLEEFLASVESDPEVIPGVHVESVTPVQPVGGRVRYWAESPILIRRDGTHYTYDEAEADEGLTQSLRLKLAAIGFPEDVRQSVRAEFDKSYDKARTKVVQVGKAKYRANVCPLYIEAGDPLLHEMAMSAGLGGLTGMGLGAILPSTNQGEANR
jgi:CRISPR-associated endoribonuclease Cas6